MKNYKKVKIYVGDDELNRYQVTNLENKVYEFQDDTCINKIEINNDNIILTRDNEEFLLIVDKTKKDAYYKLKELNYELDIPINYFDLFEDNNNLIITYQLETNDKEIKLILEGE